MDVDFLDQVDEEDVPEDRYHTVLLFAGMLASDIWDPFEMDVESFDYYYGAILGFFYTKVRPDNFLSIIRGLVPYQLYNPVRNERDYEWLLLDIAILYRCRLGRPECEWGSYFTIKSCAISEYACGKSTEEYIQFRYSPMDILFLNAVVDLMFQARP